MKKTVTKPVLAIIAILSACVFCACAASPKATPNPDGSAKGDRELKRGIYWYHHGCSRKALTHLQAAHEHYSLANQQAGVARSLTSLANLYRQADNPENAILFYDAAISAARRCDDTRRSGSKTPSAAGCDAELSSSSDSNLPGLSPR